MRILITGATGLVGQSIVKLCQQHHIQVHYLTTSKAKLVDTEDYKGFYWNPSTQDIDKTCFKDVDVILHLAGATISKRWTPTYKKEILESRIASTNLLINALKNENHSVKQVISASAIGLYPDSLVHYYDETQTQVSDSFLGEVVHAWEHAVDGFSELNITVSKIRIGLVLSAQGGALKEMLKPIKLGAGAAFGSGEQWQSWIHIDDLANLFLFVAQHELEGVYNGVAPNPVTNTVLVKTIAQVLNKPLFLPNIPKFIMKLVLGDMHILLFESQHVDSKKIISKGFQFKFYDLKVALEDLAY